MNYEQAWDRLKCELRCRGEWMFFAVADRSNEELSRQRDIATYGLKQRLDAISITLQEMEKIEKKILRLVK